VSKEPHRNSQPSSCCSSVIGCVNSLLQLEVLIGELGCTARGNRRVEGELVAEGRARALGSAGHAYGCVSRLLC
jgi:hypothetical protein